MESSAPRVGLSFRAQLGVILSAAKNLGQVNDSRPLFYPETHAPDNDDFWNNFKYIKWKYGATLDIINPGFDSFVIDADDCVGCLTGCNYACWFWGTITFGRSVFTGTENQAASIIGHELKHTVGDGGECTSYTWEWDNRFNTGIDQDQPYLQDVQLKMGEECP